MKFLFVIFSVFLFACETEIPKPETLGPHDLIVVLADSSDFFQLEKPIKSALEVPVFVPIPETLFTVKHVPISKIGSYERWQNLLVTCVYDKKGQTDIFVKDVLTEQAKQKIQNNEVFLGVQKNIWSKHQGLVYLVGKNAEIISDFLEKNGETLLKTFEEVQKEQLLYRMYNVGEQKNIEEKLMEKFGWSVRVQFEYVLANEDEKNDFVWLRRFNPDRFLSVKSFKGTGNENFSEKFWIALRDSLGKKYHQNSEVDTLRTTAKNVKFLDYEAIKLSGLWVIREDLVGGPFRSYCFFDKASGKYFLIDLAVFAPGEDKKNYLTQLEIIASTFKIK
ncbi:DUF4837 family protein [bacterium]|nr:DUF4837 family protein [bacterium]